MVERLRELGIDVDNMDPEVAPEALVNIDSSLESNIWLADMYECIRRIITEELEASSDEETIEDETPGHAMDSDSSTAAYLAKEGEV